MRLISPSGGRDRAIETVIAMSQDRLRPDSLLMINLKATAAVTKENAHAVASVFKVSKSAFLKRPAAAENTIPVTTQVSSEAVKRFVQSARNRSTWRKTLFKKAAQKKRRSCRKADKAEPERPNP